MSRFTYTPDNKKDVITKEMLHTLYHVPESEIMCSNCNFLNLPTVDFDARTGHCFYWKTCMHFSTFCSHFTPRVKKGGNDHE